MSNGNQWNKRHLAADEADQKFEGRDYTRLYRVSQGNVSLKTSRIGVECLTFAAVESYQEKTGHVLPHNLGSLSGYKHFGVFVDEGHVILEQNARFSGWLKRAAESPACGALRRFIAKTTSFRGEGSPYTSLHLRQVASRFYSPETANRRLVAVRNRANQILSNYGICVSNDALAGEMHCRKPVGKSARRAAAKTISDLLSRKFGYDVNDNGVQASRWSPFYLGRGIGLALNESHEIRHWIGSRLEAFEFLSIKEALEAKDRLIIDTTDGVEMTIDPVTTIVKTGVSVTLGFHVDWDRNKPYVQKFYLIRKGERTFHTRPTGWGRWDGVQVVKADPVLNAIREAIGAWRKQDEAKAEFELPLNQTVLVWFEDSLSVGNCAPGTQAFMSRAGIPKHRRFVAIDQLLPFVGEQLVKKVIAHAIRAAKGQLASAVR